jgi:2-polyprenyl-6-methoxyphenol hydroxylase-like FAD-dependent oxidoreductase
MTEDRTTCCVVGGGPAGLVLGLLMARAGVEVTVLEKHADFLRDFRGDTVHTSTMTLIDELGLWDRFATLPWKPIEQARVTLDAGTATIGDLSRLHAPHPFIAMVPQWHLLDLLAGAAEEEPSFRLIREAEVVDLLRDGERVAGVRWRDRTDQAEHVLHADIVVACDGRDSLVRELSGLPEFSYDVPMDVWWFRLPRGDGRDNPSGGLGRVTRGRLMVFLDRGDYYQVAYLIPRGTDAEYRRSSVQTLRDELRRLAPWVGDRVDAIGSWDDVKLLQVALNRLRTWSAPGVLCIGDAAHAMSPIGGVGINLAVQDAVATARRLAPVLRDGRGPEAVDRAARWVQRRRWLPTWLTQSAQQLAHHRVVGSVIGNRDDAPGTTTIPLPLRILQRFPALQVIPARAVGIGVLPEHAPSWARRAPMPVEEAAPTPTTARPM